MWKLTIWFRFANNIEKSMSFAVKNYDEAIKLERYYKSKYINVFSVQIEKVA